jgi:benzaldehyde dehydrogenase (NAD)
MLLADCDWQGQLWLDGWSPGTEPSIPVIEPATGAIIAELGVASPADVVRATKVAVAAQREWAATAHTERAGVLRRVGDLVLEHAAEIQDWLVRESGSVLPKAQSEHAMTVQECYEAAGLPGRPYGRLLRSEQPRLSWSQRVPAGVVGVIAPFNGPLLLAMRSVAPALALGNAVILKPDTRTAVCGGIVIARLFALAGLPEGLLHVLPGPATVGEALVTEPQVRVVSFTGSSTAGRRVGELAARHGKRALLEMGGNSALIVFDDVDADRAAAAAAVGSFSHQGQICVATGRHLVHQSIYEEFVDRLAARAESLPVGDPTRSDVALGPIIDEQQRDRVHDLVTRSVSEGARLAAGGTYEELFYRPTVLADVTRTTPAYVNEVFGPVASVLSFADAAEAAYLAADSDFGLSLGILTRDVMKGLALAELIPSGMVHINDQTVNDEATNPFGGVRGSGNGSRLGGAEDNIEAFTENRWVTVRGGLPAYP